MPEKPDPAPSAPAARGPAIDPIAAVKLSQQDMRIPLRKRFYEAVSVAPADGGFGLLLDRRRAKTPGGAWEFHTSLIPNSPVKPIRLWMAVGDRDNYNPNIMRDGMHDWVEANHRMATVLAAKGYRYQYVFALNVGHGMGAARNQTLAHALEWVWKDYPIK